MSWLEDRHDLLPTEGSAEEDHKALPRRLVYSESVYFGLITLYTFQYLQPDIGVCLRYELGIGHLLALPAVVKLTNLVVLLS